MISQFSYFILHEKNVMTFSYDSMVEKDASNFHPSTSQTQNADRAAETGDGPIQILDAVLKKKRADGWMHMFEFSGTNLQALLPYRTIRYLLLNECTQLDRLEPQISTIPYPIHPLNEPVNK